MCRYVFRLLTAHMLREGVKMLREGVEGFRGWEVTWEITTILEEKYSCFFCPCEIWTPFRITACAPKPTQHEVSTSLTQYTLFHTLHTPSSGEQQRAFHAKGYFGRGQEKEWLGCSKRQLPFASEQPKRLYIPHMLHDT